MPANCICEMTLIVGLDQDKWTWIFWNSFTKTLTAVKSSNANFLHFNILFYDFGDDNQEKCSVNDKICFSEWKFLLAAVRISNSLHDIIALLLLFDCLKLLKPQTNKNNAKDTKHERILWYHWNNKMKCRILAELSFIGELGKCS